jgi:hypothetical protein
MRTIHKIAVALDMLRDVLELDLPVGAVPISVGNQNEKLCIWYITDERTSSGGKDIERKLFRVAGTGHPLDAYFPVEKEKFLGTAIFMNGSLVIHVFAH